MKKETTAQDKAVIFWFTTSTIGLFCFQVYAIFNSASSFGASLWMAGIIAGISAVTPDAFAWIANLLNYTGWRKWGAIGVGVSISTAIGVVFSTMMTAELALIAIYMLVQLAMIAVQVLTADVAIEAIFSMPPAIVRQLDKQNKEREQVIAVVDANIDSVKEQIEDAVRIIVDAIPQPAPAPDLSSIEAQIEELNETVKGLQAVPVTAPKPPKKTMSPDERVEWLKDNDEAYINHLAGLTSLTASTIRRDLYKARNGAGK